ncbi:hypothetical protein DYB37_003028 [Aphanomyces astaci]|uniref:EF-hand domain-containing protein n=1 Tax=Aphanomyces astaci TaxID=112090 RepID=A0A418F6Y6_APHAT|nr:hypothetical protein DYB37_003028 [Aphanomyces astaci]
MPPKQQRAASAAPTRPTTNSNPRNLLRPKSSTAQRKLTATSADPERVPSSSIHLAGPLHRTATNNNQHASPGILAGSSLKVPPSSAPPFHPSNEVVLPRASGPPPSRPQSAAATKLLSKRSNRPQTAAASASKRVKSAKTRREPSAEPQENDVADMHVSTVEKALDVHLGGGNGKPSSPLKAKHWSPPKHFVTLRQTPMKSPSKSLQLTTPTTSSRPPTSSDSLKPVRDCIEAWMSRKQIELADDSDKSNFHVTFQYAVPAHHFDRSAPYDPYTITYHTVYNAHDGGVRGLQFTDDDRLIDQQIACDFYVMSPKNVLFYNKDHATVTLQSLKEWERERRIFQTLKTLPLFSTCVLCWSWHLMTGTLTVVSRYRRTKAMKCWVSHHILRKRQRCKDLLNDLVYFCNPIFYATMDAIQDKIMGLHTQLLFFVDRATVISPHEFQRRQVRQQIFPLRLEFFALCDAIRQVLVDMSHKYLSHYSSTDAVIKYADVSLTSRKSTTFHMDQFFGTIQKKASPFSPLAPCSEDPTVAGELDLVAIRAELQRSRVRAKSRESIKEKPTMDAIKWSVAAVKRARCSELSRFIRRVDYMLLDAFHSVINRSAAVLSGAGKSSSLLLSKDAYMRAYHRFDIYGNGSLDGAQITRLLHHVFDGKLTDTALEDRVGLFISVFDENGDGDVSIEEFSKGLDVVLDVERMEQFDVSANSIYETTRLAHTNLFIPVPLFEVNVVFDGAHGLSFDPPLKSVQSAIEMTLRGFFDANEHVQRLIQDPTIVSVLTFYDQVRTCQLEAVPPQKSGGGGGPPSDAPISLILFERASQDQAYMHLCEQIFDIVKGSICGCQAYANCFLPLCDEFDWNNGLDFDEIAQKHMDGTYDIERLTQDVKTFHHQLIRVKTLALKTALLPSPVRCLKELERILPILAEKNIAKLLTYIELVASKIQRPPAKDLEAFVTYILNLKEINDELPSKDLEAAQITDYLGLITDSGFHIPSQTQAIYDLVEPELSTLKSAVTNCMARRDMDIREYSVLLEQKIQHTESCAEQLFEADTEALNALAFTGNLKQLATDYTVRADRFVFVRSLFNEFLPACMPDVPSNGNGYFASLPKLTANINLKHSMWTLIMEADQSISSWGDIDLRHMPQEAMHDLLDRVTALHGVLGVELPTSPVTARVFELKELLSHTTSIVQNLCNGHVEERHWQKLENKLCVAFQYEVEPATNAVSSDDQRCLVRQVDISFKYLMSLNIHDKHADINEIVQEAVTEAAISKSLHDAIRVWETKEIAFSYWTDSDTRDIVVLGDTSECINMLEESDIKRQSYPRFCTLSDSELTDLISACRNPHNIQQYLPSCFPSLGVVSFDNDDKSMGIVAVRSPPRPFEEVISMGKNLKARGYVEQWLSHMDRRLSERLQKMIKDLVAHFTATVTQRTWDLNYLREFPLQCIVVANDITTTSNFGHKVAQIEMSTTTSVRIKQLTASLTSGDRLLHPCLVSTLLLQQFYYRDTLLHLSEIPWANHPHYVTTDDEVHLAVGDLALPYGYAYHNPTESYLVVTPVTERYLLAVFNCAGVVSGGACSGKTSLLQLATIMLGRDLIQTFCTSITSLKQIHRFITGGIGSGGTLLLRNADLLVGPILSFINVVVSTIMVIYLRTYTFTLDAHNCGRKQNSALTTKHAITLDDREHVIDAGSMIMLTTSSLSSCPVSPHHFRALCESLSSISVMCPAMEQILHAVFFCYGFDLALTLARMLSLVWNEMRGVALRLAPEKNHARFFTIHTAKHCAKLMLGRHMSDEIQLLKDTLQVYLTTGLHLLPDIRTYAMSYIKSLWLVKDYTSVSTHTDDGSGTTINQSDFQTMLKGTYTRHYFVPSEASLHVASALMQAVASHRSIILCGPLKTGKTTCVNMLAAALNDLFVDVDGANPTLPQFPDPPPQDSRFIVIKTLLPMSLSMAQLYGGSIDGNTDTSLIKSVVTENVPCPLPHSAEGFKTNATDTVPRDVAPLLTHRQRVWLVLDGSMEAAWTEHILSLASPSPSSSVTSGLSQFSLLESEDTFTLPSNVTVLFETVDLDHASPTLVLNCSLIHASPFHQPVNDANTSSVRPLQQPLHKLYLIGAIARVRAQIAVPPLVCDLLTKYLVDSTLMDRLLEVLSEGTLHAHLSPLHTAQNVMTLVQSMLSIQPGVDYSLWTKALDVDPASSLNEPRHVLTRQIELAILWSIGWGVGSSASSQTKRLVASVLQREFEHLQDTWANCGGGDMGLYSWVLHLATVTFRPCKDVLCPPSGTRDLSPFSIYIPRVESTLVQLVSKQVLRSGVPLLVFGPADSGSTSCVVDFLQRSSAFAAQGLTTQDRSNIVVTPDKAEAVRISTHRLTTTLIISSLASKLKTKRNECRSSARSSSCVVGKPGPPTRPPDVDAAASVCFETGSFVSTRIQCTPATTIDAVSATVERVMHRERKHVYEPPPGKAMVLFFDDLHLPDHNDPVRHQIGHLLAVTIDMFLKFRTLDAPLASVFCMAKLMTMLEFLTAAPPLTLPDLSVLLRLWHHETHRTFVDTAIALDRGDVVQQAVDVAYASLCDHITEKPSYSASRWIFFPHGYNEKTNFRQRQDSLDSALVLLSPEDRAASIGLYRRRIVAAAAPPSLERVSSMADIKQMNSPQSKVVGLQQRQNTFAKPLAPMLQKKESANGNLHQRKQSGKFDQDALGNRWVSSRGGLASGEAGGWNRHLADRVKDEKLFELNALHAKEMENLRFELSVAKRAELLAKHDLVRRQIADSREVHSKTAKERELEAMMDLEKHLNAQGQEKIDALMSVQHSAMDDFLRKVEANADIHMSVTMAAVKPSGVVSGIWNEVVQAAARNLRVVVCCEAADVSDFVRRGPKMFAQCQVCLVPALEFATLKPVIHGRIEAQWKVFQEQETLLESTVVLNLFELIQSQLDHMSTLAAKLHLAASRVMLANGAKDAAAAVISLHHIPLYARNIFDSIKRLGLRMNQLMNRSRSFLDVYQTAVDQVDSAQTQHQLKQLQIQSTMLQIGEYKLHFEKMQAEAEVIRTLMRKQKADVDEQVKITTEMDKLTKHELKDALKVLDEANKCVANLDRRYIMEIKTFVNPPVLVHVVLNAMCVLFSVEPSWDNAKKLLSDVNFITSMLNYEKDNVPEAILIKLEPYLTNEMFNKTEVEKQSIAASTMVVWIIAIDAYSRSRKLVKPKLDILDAAQAKLRALVAEFSECKKKVDQADKVSSDIEETIQARMEDKMVEYEATLLGEAVVSAAVLTYAGVFSRGLRVQLFDAWAVELASQPLHIHPTHSILNGYAGQPFGLWLKVAGLFHSRHSQQTAYLLAHALPVVLVTSFSPHMDSMLRNVLHAVGCNSVVTKSAQDKDVRSVLESCILMGQQLVVHDVTPLLYKSIFHDLVEWDTEWVDGVEHLIYVGHTLTLKRGFRLVLTATAPLAEFGSDVFHVVTVDAAVCWDDMQNVLLDDMELANVGNVDKTGGGGAYDCAKTIMDMEVDLDRSFDALLVHLRNMIREAKYDAALVDSLATMCHQNAQHRSTLDDRRQELDRTMAIRSDTSFAAVTQLGQQVYAALQRLSTLVPDLILALEPYGFRILFIQSLESCGTDVRSKAAGAKCSTPGDVLHKLLEVIAFTIPHEHWQSFLLLLAFEVRAESLQDAENPSELPCPDIVPCGDDDLASIPLKALQRRALVPSRWNAIFTDEAITAMSTTSTDQLFQAFEACTRDVMVIKRTRQVSMATTQPSQSSQIVPSWHDDLPSLVRMPAPYLCLGLLLQCPTKTFDSFCEQLALHTLGLEPKEAVAHRRWGPKDWYKMLINTPDAWYWCVASNAGFTTLSLLHAIMSTIVPREVWPDVLKLLLQRPTVHALSFQVPPDSGSILGHFDSVPSMVQFEGFNPSAFETLQWFVLDMTTSEKWDAVVQYNKKFRLDYRPVGLVPHLKPTLGKPMHQRHAADDDMHSSRMLHIVPTSKARPFTLANVPLAVQPNRLVLHPLGSNPFATEFRRTLLRLVSIPFSSSIGDALELVNADPAVRNVVAIVLWRLFCGLVFFHAALVARQDMVVGRAVDVATVDGSDLVLGVYVITGPLLQTIVQAFVHTTDDTDPLDQLHWPAIHDLFMQHAHGRKCITLRGLHLVRALLRDCVGSYLLIPNSPPQQSKFQLPLPAFQDMLKTPTQSTDEYLTVMCAFASSCKWTVVDVVVPAPVLSIDLRHLVMLPHYRNIPPLHLKQYLVAIATHCLQSLPSALSLKLHPRNALVQHPLRQFLKTVIHAFHRRRDGVEAALQRLVLDITQFPPMTLAGFVAISTNNINDGSNSLARDCRALVMDQLPARLATHTPPLDMSLSAAIKHWQLTASFLTKWWDEAHTEYWCPAILDMTVEPYTDLMSAFGFTHKMETNTVANVGPLAFIGHVYAMDTPLEAYRNRNNTILLTGLELLNAAPSSTSPGRIREAPGEAMPVQVLLKVSLDNSVTPASNDTMECPMLQSRRSSTPVGTVPLEITPSIHEWATCPYLVLTPGVASL